MPPISYYNLQLARKYQKRFSRFLKKYPKISFTLSQKVMNQGCEEVFKSIGFETHTVHPQSVELLMKKIPLWLINDNLTLFHYKSDKGESILNILRAIKRESKSVPFSNLVPVFYANPTGKRQMEIFRLFAGFGVRHAIFMTPSSDKETNLLELVEGILEFEKISDADKPVASSNEKKALKNIGEYQELVKKADSLLLKGKYEEAIELYNKAIELKVDFEALIHRGDAYFKLGKFKLALKDYQEAAKLEQSVPEPFAKVGECCFQLAKAKVKGGDASTAKGYVDKGVKYLNSAKEKIDDYIKQNLNKPERIPAYPYKHLVEALITADLRGTGFKKAMESINEITGSIMDSTVEINYLDNNLDAEVRINFAIILTRNNMFEKAEQILRSVTKEKPKEAAPTLNNFAIELLKGKESRKAFEIYCELMEYRDEINVGVVIDNLKTAGLKHAEELRDDFKLDEAIEVYKKVLSFEPKGVEWILCDFAMTFLEQQNQFQASSRLMEAIYLNPSIGKSKRFKTDYADLVNLRSEMMKKLKNSTSM